MHKGSCLCGAVELQVEGDLKEAVACHCTVCRKWTGHYGVGVEVPRDKLKIEGAEDISWFQSSDHARRGFCAKCGTSLFFDPTDREKNNWVVVYMGVFDKPTGAKMALHIFAAEKGDYYEITDGVPQNEY